MVSVCEHDFITVFIMIIKSVSASGWLPKGSKTATLRSSPQEVVRCRGVFKPCQEGFCDDRYVAMPPLQARSHCSRVLQECAHSQEHGKKVH